MLSKRIIVCLDVKDRRVVKGTAFQNHRDMGDPLSLARFAEDQGADELVVYDISASPEGRGPDLGLVRELSQSLRIPLCVAGGIRNLAIAEATLHAGADKVSINSPALERPELINELAEAFGTQCVVVGMDSRFDGDDYYLWRNTGSVEKAQRTPRKTFDWIDEVMHRGAGEVVLNAMASDGLRQGFDCLQVGILSEKAKIPIIASGGAGRIEHFKTLFTQTKASGGLLAGAFQDRSLNLRELKLHLSQNAVPMRLLCPEPKPEELN